MDPNSGNDHLCPLYTFIDVLVPACNLKNKHTRHITQMWNRNGYVVTLKTATSSKVALTFRFSGEITIINFAKPDNGTTHTTLGDKIDMRDTNFMKRIEDAICVCYQNNQYTTPS